MLHHFSSNIEGIELPKLFTYPFHYTPHPLAVRAAEEVQQYIASHSEWHEELDAGKMFGVLVVEHEGEVASLPPTREILPAETTLNTSSLRYTICCAPTTSSNSKRQISRL